MIAQAQIGKIRDDGILHRTLARFSLFGRRPPLTPDGPLETTVERILADPTLIDRLVKVQGAIVRRDADLSEVTAYLGAAGMLPYLPTAKYYLCEDGHEIEIVGNFDLTKAGVTVKGFVRPAGLLERFLSNEGELPRFIEVSECRSQRPEEELRP